VTRLIEETGDIDVLVSNASPTEAKRFFDD
jgi:hypothetical protein